MFASSNWSNGSTWMDILERGLIEGQKVTILNMLEYMGVWEWYDSQVRSLQESGRIFTKKGKPAGRRVAATHVLNKMQSGKWIKALGRLTLEDGDRERPALHQMVKILLMNATGDCGEIVSRHNLAEGESSVPSL